MRTQIDKYLCKMEAQGLALPGKSLFVAMDADLFLSRPLLPEDVVFTDVLRTMSVCSLLFAEPMEPYWSILKELSSPARSAVFQVARKDGMDTITPMDCETRTFFHDIPVIDDLSCEAIIAALSRRKAAIVRGRGIITQGGVTPEQAFVSFSSACFSTFVKYFYDCLVYLEWCRKTEESPDPGFVAKLIQTLRLAGEPPCVLRPLAAGPAVSAEDVFAMIAEAGKAVVRSRLVDSTFGNVSCRWGDAIYISQTGSSLDELDGMVDIVPLDGSSCVGITASSELSAHRKIYEETGDSLIVHGHPKFSVILSMHCTKEDCERGACYKSCRVKRYVGNVPIVSGEIGTGATALMHTVPSAMAGTRCAIVFGHGIFASGRDDFAGPVNCLCSIERDCQRLYGERVAACLGL